MIEMEVVSNQWEVVQVEDKLTSTEEEELVVVG